MRKSTNAIIRQLEKSLPDHGHLAKPIGKETLMVRLPGAGPGTGGSSRTAAAVIHPDSNGNGLVVECCWAVNTVGAGDANAVLAKCTETAFKLPLVQVQHDPRDGEVRLRVDCLSGDNGRRTVEQVARSLTALNDFLTAIAVGSATTPVVPPAAAAGESAADTAARLEALARKPGGINRLETLLRLNQSRRPPAPPSSN